MLAHAHILCIRELRKDDCQEFEAVLVYIVSSRRGKVLNRIVKKGKKKKEDETATVKMIWKRAEEFDMTKDKADHLVIR